MINVFTSLGMTGIICLLNIWVSVILFIDKNDEDMFYAPYSMLSTAELFFCIIIILNLLP